MTESANDSPAGVAAPGQRLFLRGVQGIQLVALPIYLGMILTLAIFAVSFFYSLYDAVESRDFLNRRTAILLVLDLLDMVFIANLIVMVMISGYNAYCAASSRATDPTRQISFADQFAPVKVQIASTLVIISGIHLLHEVLSDDRSAPVELLVLGGIHLVLVAGAATFALISTPKMPGQAAATSPGTGLALPAGQEPSRPQATADPAMPGQPARSGGAGA